MSKASLLKARRKTKRVVEKVKAEFSINVYESEDGGSQPSKVALQSQRLLSLQ